MEYKMIVLDMDDTLMTSENKMSEGTKQALLDIQKQGVKVVLASGRPTGGMVPTALELELDKNESYILSYNGAHVISMKNQSIILRQPVTKSQFDAIYDYCQKNGLFVLTYADNEIVYDGEHEYMNIEHELTGLPMKKVDNLKSFIQSDVPKVLSVDYEAHISQLNQQLNGHFGDDIHATTSKPFFLEFMHQNVSKGQVLKQLCDKINIPAEAVICVGDSNNDKDMLEFAGLGIAMGNANEAIKQVADDITDDNNNDGIKKMIEKYFNH